MASISVITSGYWGDDTILSSGSWSALAWNDTVTIQDGAICTVDPAQQTPTGIDVGVNIVCTAGFSKLIINNTSTTTALSFYGSYQGTLQVENGCEFKVTGNYIQIGTGDGTLGQQLTGFTSFGFDAMDVPAVIFIETVSGSDVYEPWMNCGNTLISEMGVGTLGRWFSYDDSTGYITFGDNGKQQSLSANASSGQTDITVVDASDFIADDYIHLKDDLNQETLEISSISGNVITCKTNLEHSYTLSNNAFIRLVRGGNVVPNGSKIRVYNTVVGTKNNLDEVIVADIVGNNFELDTSKGGFLSLSKVLFTGFYLNIAYPGELSINGMGVLNTIYPYFLVNQTFKNTYVCSDKYTISPSSAFQNVGTVSSSLTFEDCIFVSENLARTVVGLPLTVFRRVQIWMLSITVSTNRVLNSGNFDGCTFEDCLFVGGITFGYAGSRQTIKNLIVSSSQNGIPYVFSSNYIISSSLDSATQIENVLISPDGCSGASTTFFSIVVGTVKNLLLESKTCTYLMSIGMGSLKLINIKGKHVSGNLPINFLNSNYDVTIQNFHMDALVYLPWQHYLPSKCIFKGFDTNTRDVSFGIGPTLDTHFYELRGPDNFLSGIMGLIFNPRSDLGTGHTESNKDDLRWNMNGRMYIISAGGWVEYTWPHRIIGITAFPSDGSVTVHGLGTENFTIQYKIDVLDGNGYSEWATLNHANLSMHTINPNKGFLFKVKISHSTGSTSDYLDRLNWDTTVDYDTYRYPEDIVNITLQNIKDGSRYWIYNETTEKEIASGTQSGSLDVVIPEIPYNGSDEILLIRVRKGGGGSLDYKPFETNATLTSNGATVWISQVLDDLT